jgi:hypothetical protein
MNKRIYIATILTLTILIIGIYSKSFDRYERDFVYDMCILVMGIALLVTIIFVIVNLISIIIKKSIKDYKIYVPIGIALIGILFAFSPFLNDEPLPPTSFQACYEGTQNFALATFRINNTFEISTNTLARPKWYSGTWRKTNDSLFVTFTGEKLNTLLGDTNIISEEYLFPLNKDTIRDKRGKFYLGVCK